MRLRFSALEVVRKFDAERWMAMRWSYNRCVCKEARGGGHVVSWLEMASNRVEKKRCGMEIACM